MENDVSGMSSGTSALTLPNACESVMTSFGFTASMESVALTSVSWQTTAVMW